MADTDKHDVVRMNHDTIYSGKVSDLDAASITVVLPDPSKRFMSMQVVSEDHFTPEMVYAPGTFSYTKEKVGTSYVCTVISMCVLYQFQFDSNIYTLLKIAALPACS